MNKDDDIFEYNASSKFGNLFEMANTNDDGGDQGGDKCFGIIEDMNKDDDMLEYNVSSTFDNLFEMSNTNDDGGDKGFDIIEDMNKDDDMLEYNVSSMFDNLFEMSNTNDDEGDKGFDIIEEMEGAKSEPNLGIVIDNPLIEIDNFEENKENLAPDHRKRTKLFKSKNLFPCDLESNANNINIDVNIQVKNDNNISNQNLNSLILPTNTAKGPVRSQKIKILNSCNGVQVVENQAIGNSGIKVPEKQPRTIPKPLSFESRKSCAKPHSVKNAEQWMFNARPATVLKKKPFIPKYEKKYTESKNIQLNTERRAQEWMIFEEEKKEKFEMEQEKNRKKEMDLIKKLRQQTIHKAEPIKKYKPILIKKSVKPVTVPHSPKFSTRPIRSRLNSVTE